jgi:hypothetical protein
MEAMLENGRIPTEGIGFRKYEVDLTECRLHIGQPVTPETIVGRDRETGQLVTAGLHGRVATIYFNPMHDSLLITAV